jgi:hypothetical protein
MTDVRKAVSSTTRPATMTRRTTPTAAPKLGKNPRDREREWEEERWWDEERESFPQYWYVVLALSLAFLHLRLAFPFPLKVSPFGQAAPSPDMRVICVTLDQRLRMRGRGPWGERGTMPFLQIPFGA